MTLPTILAYKPSVQLLSRVRLFATPWTIARQASLSIINSRRSLKLRSMASVMPSSHLILSSPSPPAFIFFPASGSFPVSQFFTSGAKVLEFQFQQPIHHRYKIIKKLNHNKQGVFKPRLMMCWLISTQPKQATCPA